MINRVAVQFGLGGRILNTGRPVLDHGSSIKQSPYGARDDAEEDICHAHGEEELARQKYESEYQRDENQQSQDSAQRLEAERRPCRIWHVAHHEKRESGHEVPQKDMPWQVANNRFVVQRRLTEPVVAREYTAGRRTRQSPEVRLAASRLLDVEACEPDDGGGDESEREQPIPAFLVQHREIHDHRRCHAERDRVHERIEFFAKRRARAGCARHTPVHSVAQSADQDAAHREGKVSARSGNDREHAEEQIQQGDAARQHHH